MKTDTLIYIISAITKSGWLDTKYLIELIEKYELDIEEIVESIELNFWKEFSSDINYLIYESLNQIAYKFIGLNENIFETESDEFEIYTNYIDSYIWFESEKVQSEFERWD